MEGRSHGAPGGYRRRHGCGDGCGGVDGAILVSPWTMYRYDESYALEVYAAHPGRFGLVKPVDPAEPAVTGTIAHWAAMPGTVGIRIMLSHGVTSDPDDPGINRVLAAV